MDYFLLPLKWFRGFDILIELFSIFAALMIAVASYRYYRISRNRKYMHLSISFSVIAVSFLLKSLSYSLMYYYKVIHLHTMTLVVKIVETPIQGLRPSFILFTITLFLFKFMHLIGLYMLYYVYQRKYSRPDIILAIVSFFLITVLSTSSNFAFHLVAFTMLTFLTNQYYRLYRKNRRKNTKLLFLSFFMIALSQAIFIFASLDNLLYVYGEIIQLLGYVMLLVTFIMVIKHGKKKKQD